MDQSFPRIELIASPDWKDHELQDSGNGIKLERYGPYLFSRPEAQAVWQPTLPEKAWRAAHANFQTSSEENGGHWQFNKPVEARWAMQYKGLHFWAQTSSSRHMGVFPEQASQWDWIAEQISEARRPTQVLNLFGYTGLASLAAAQAGARVTHVDASKKVINWARENQSLSGLEDRPIRWIVDDALKFVLREGRRGARYDGLILDPPKFGRGPKGEVWEFYNLLPALLQACKDILSQQPGFICLTAYAIQASALTIYNAVSEITADLPGEVTAGELVTVESSAGRTISNAIFSRWRKNS
jgi:23S rRNA (cytosine1962-C5)-methyltransferase